MRDLVSLHYHQHLVLSLFFILAVLIGVYLYLMWSDWIFIHHVPIRKLLPSIFYSGFTIIDTCYIPKPLVFPHWNSSRLQTHNFTQPLSLKLPWILLSLITSPKYCKTSEKIGIGLHLEWACKFKCTKNP